LTYHLWSSYKRRSETFLAGVDPKNEEIGLLLVMESHACVDNRLHIASDMDGGRSALCANAAERRESDA
jgi:hypothetical protein